MTEAFGYFWIDAGYTKATPAARAHVSTVNEEGFD